MKIVCTQIEQDNLLHIIAEADTCVVPTVTCKGKTCVECAKKCINWEIVEEEQNEGNA